MSIGYIGVIGPGPEDWGFRKQYIRALVNSDCIGDAWPGDWGFRKRYGRALIGSSCIGVAGPMLVDWRAPVKD